VENKGGCKTIQWDVKGAKGGGHTGLPGLVGLPRTCRAGQNGCT